MQNLPKLRLVSVLGVGLALGAILFGLSVVSGAPADNIPIGSTFKCQQFGTVYYVTSDRRRAVFPNSIVFGTWYRTPSFAPDFSGLITVPSLDCDSVLRDIPLAGNVTVRPGEFLVKFQYAPEIYAVEFPNILRHVTGSQAYQILRAMYPSADSRFPDRGWEGRVRTVPDIYYDDYVFGQPIDEIGDFNVSAEMAQASTVAALMSSLASTYFAGATSPTIPPVTPPTTPPTTPAPPTTPPVTPPTTPPVTPPTTPSNPPSGGLTVAPVGNSVSAYFIGHSLTSDIPDMLEDLAASRSGQSFSFRQQQIMGSPLRYQWAERDRANSGNPHDSFGERTYNTPYYTALAGNNYNTLILTDSVPRGGAEMESETVDYLGRFVDFARSGNPNIQVYYYETWHCADTGPTNGCMYDTVSPTRNLRWVERIRADRAMWERIVNNVNSSRSNSRPVRIIPAATALAVLADAIAAGEISGFSSYRDLFDLNADRSFDHSHLNHYGKYFVSLVHYATIYQRSPVGLPVNLNNRWGVSYWGTPDYKGISWTRLNDAAARRMQEIAWQVVTGYGLSGVPGTGTVSPTTPPVTPPTTPPATTPTQPTTPPTTPAQPSTPSTGANAAGYIPFTSNSRWIGRVVSAAELLTRDGFERREEARVSPDGSGNFRIQCPFSHANYDDPIVYPGQAGRSHLHYYFGNQEVDAYTTVSTLQTVGVSTCPGATVNRSAYWVPALLDSRGNPVIPLGGDDTASIYYKAATDDVAAVQPMPEGLRMIAGNAGAGPNNRQYKGIVHWDCHRSRNRDPRVANPLPLDPITNTDQYFDHIPPCPIGDTLMFTLQFPMCWDGRNLDSPNHQSHMAYQTARQVSPGRYEVVCPSTHPVPLPQVTYNIQYEVTAQNAGPDGTSRGWRLSSDMYDLNTNAGGMSAHGDWFMAWDVDIMTTLTRNCINRRRDSSSGNLCNGTALTWFQPGPARAIPIENRPTSGNTTNHANH